MFSYPPLTDEQIVDSLGLIPKGVYPFLSTSAEYSLSKTDHSTQVVKLGLKIDTPSGRSEIVYTWLTEKMLYRIRHFWEASKCPQFLLTPPANEGDWVNRRGFAVIDVKHDEYGVKNIVIDFIKEENAAGHRFNAPVATKSSASVIDIPEEILPF